MGHYLKQVRDSLRKGDMILLLMCLIVTTFGCLMISSATQVYGSGGRYVVIQVSAALIGVLVFAITSSIDAEFFSEHRTILVLFNMFLLALLIPFGTDNGTGNRSWLNIPLLPVDIQPAEICKLAYVLIMASVMNANQNRLSSIPSIMQMVFHLGLLVGVNMILSRDAGVSLIFVFIFIGMAFAGGVSMLWFLIAGGGLAVALPFIYEYVMGDYQRLRIQVLFDPSLDPLGTGARYHTMRSLRSLTGGGVTGQGLFQGNRTNTFGALYAQHTDYIFSAIGEELGYVGCFLVIAALVCIIARCIWVGNRSQDYMRRLICYGVASAVIFQIIVNVGMCMGVMPVIGLTLPFISYGGSSLVSLYAMMGLVSGVYARPAATSHERYIRPPYKTIHL
jgi:rod shape determining protein RodA